MKYKLFLAWQSQNEKTASYINKHLKKAVKKLKDEGGIEIDVIKTPTQDKSGSPEINTEIWNEIFSSDIFVADVSFFSKSRPYSNSNVMYELGIADAFLGSERTILLADENTKIEKLAFDINHKRVSKINTANQNFYKEFAEWLRYALVEADLQRNIRAYSVEEYMEEIILLLNHFYRMAYMSDMNYSAGLECPSLEVISNSISNGIFPEIYARADFSKIVKCMEDKVVRLRGISDKKITNLMMNVLNGLKGYQDICTGTQYRYLIAQSGLGEYMVLDKGTFFLTSSKGLQSVRNTIFHNENVVICGDFNNDKTYAFDKRTIPKDCTSIRKTEQDMPDGGRCTLLKMKTYKVSSEWVEAISQSVYRIIQSVQIFLKYCGVEINNIGKNGSNSFAIGIDLK